MIQENCPTCVDFRVMNDMIAFSFILYLVSFYNEQTYAELQADYTWQDFPTSCKKIRNKNSSSLQKRMLVNWRDW